MTAINTIEDLARIMDERPEWVEAMRVRLLSREVLDLPQTISILADTMENFANSTNQRLGNIEARLDQHAVRIDAVDDGLAAVDSRFDSVEVSIQKLRNDIAPVKAAHARNAAIEDAVAIAGDLGLRHTKTLTREEIWEITEDGDTSGISSNEILEAVDKDGESCYIAVEISFTANGRDTSRAIRNAEFLKRFTGRRSVASVAGLYRDNRIDEALESGSVFWRQLDPGNLKSNSCTQ